jgi:hypothetical protein
MHSALRLLFALAALLVVQDVLAQAVRLIPSSNYGASVAPGGMGFASFTVLDSQGRPRAATVRFDESCTYLQRGELPPYACVSAVPGQPLEVTSDSSGVVFSPTYQANGTVGNAWLNATLFLDGQVVTMPFFFRIGAAPSPISIVSGNNQQVQVNQPLDEPLAVRVTDDRGRWMAGVPIVFNSQDCSGGFGAPPIAPCLISANPASPLTDASGILRSALGRMGLIPGSFPVATAFVAGPAGPTFNLTAFLPRRLAVEPRKLQGLRIVEAPATCSIDLFEVEPVAPVNKPFMLAIPHGVVRVRIGGCPAGATVKLQFLHPGGFPEGAKVWAAAPTWRALDTVNPVEGTSEFTMVEGGAGDIDATANGRIDAFLVMGYGDPESPNFQDLWWTGPAGNGWGISIVQHGQVLFPVFFVYDSAGDPTWFVMPGGRWNAARDEYSGALYSPRGRPVSAHRTADLVAGAPPGRATLRFRDALTMEVDVELPGASVRLPLVRQLFGALAPGPTPRYANMWWPGATRDGWGLVLQQQYTTVFGLLFTYRDDGKPTWVVMPSAYWSDANTLLGNAFTTKSSSWPIEYDATRLTSQQVGAFSLEFNAGRLMFEFTGPGRSDRVELTPLPF